MASMNPFDLLGDDDNDDPSQLIAAQKTLAPSQSTSQKQQKSPPAHPKLPSKLLPPAQAVREAKNETGAAGRGRGGSRGGSGGRGFGRGGGGFNREFSGTESALSNGGPAVEDGDAGRSSGRGGRGAFGGGPRAPFRGGRRGGVSNGEIGDGDRPRRQFERRSGTGRGNEFKREGSGRGNWGTATDDGFVQDNNEEIVNTTEKNLSPEKQQPIEEVGGVDNRENPMNEPEEKEPEEKEMTLEEYEKVLEEKRKALQALKTEERKVDLDKDFESMQQLSGKKRNDDIFIKLGSEKDLAKRKEIAEKDEKGKKPVSINDFLKPAEGKKFYGPGGRGRGRGDRGSRGFAGGNILDNVAAPSIEDPGQFPTLGGK
eukprot:TRINITY_DN998_c0_g3_i1.p1 TRINITY_DN998_c0_g3~~TRINITY_DN998_c0_g3_i1.p1  ORF type:complete len:371 (-),score=93.65 TRINITY_DN998_c0_g3_i1:337-1449(-)